MQQAENKKILLTEYAHGAGCGCKIAPQVLQEILSTDIVPTPFKDLLVGNQSNDDAAVFDLGGGQGLISTTDFFMPIVDDAYDFGRVAAANAISDVYAMGGKPLLALAILGWPVNKLPAALARQVVEGARAVCAEVKIPLAGGHSIDTLEPMFGLSVNGLIDLTNLKKNNTAKEGDLLYLTKALGTGIFSTAKKRKILKPEDEELLLKQLTTVNSIGEKIGKIKGVTAMTDVTGFGLMGHLIEMAEGSGLTAVISYPALHLLPGLRDYISQSIIPDATYRNWNAYSPSLDLAASVNAAEAFMVLPDPQTNGGLLFSVRPENQKDIEKLLTENGLQDHKEPIGVMRQKGEKIIRVES